MIIQIKDPLRVIQITDTHLRAQSGSRLYGVDVDRCLNAVLEQIIETRPAPDLILATGDLVQDEGEPAYERLRACLERLGVPVYCLPGNHDDPTILDRILAHGRVRRERHVLHDTWQFVLLDSTVAGTTRGHLAASELAFLDAALHSQRARHAMICLHHHPIHIDSTWLDTMVVDNGEDLFAVLDRHPQVRAVIWGHIHQAFSVHRHGVALLGAPSTCAQFKPGFAAAALDEIPPGYRWFELHRDGILKTGVERVDPAIPPRRHAT